MEKEVQQQPGATTSQFYSPTGGRSLYTNSLLPIAQYGEANGSSPRPGGWERARNVCSPVRTYVRTHVRTHVVMARRKPHLSMYGRERIKHMLDGGATTREVVENREKENISVCRQTVWRLQHHVNTYDTIDKLPKSGRPTKLTPAVLQQIDNTMEQDDETTARELQSVSAKTALNGRRLLGWTRRGTAYCQMIREPNRVKRREWARVNLGSSFGDVIWTDETSVQLESHRRFHCYKKGQKPRYKPRPKHPVKVHVWAGISRRGATGVCIFEGIMTASVYIKILEEFLVPFIRDVYPSGHEFMQDNDPKHTSRQAKEFFSQHSINWWRTPPESPDANPIENLWHELKVCMYYLSRCYTVSNHTSKNTLMVVHFISQEYIRRVTKPKRKEELVSGILRFWSTVTPSKCQKYISHLDKVIPEMIRVNGEATGF